MNAAVFRLPLASGLVLVAGVACAMTKPPAPAVPCQVYGAERLPRESGGAQALCAAVRRALAEVAGGEDYRAELRVRRPDMIEGVLIAPDGTRLPPLTVTISDAPLSRSVFDHLAVDLAALATQLSKK